MGLMYLYLWNCKQNLAKCKHFSSFNHSKISLEIVNEIHIKVQTHIWKSTFYQPEQRFYSGCTAAS